MTRYPPTISRRSVLKNSAILTGGLFIGGTATTGTVIAGNGNGHRPNTNAELSHQLNKVRKITKKYRDLETARNDGYAAASPYVPGMGFHFANEDPPFGTDFDDPGVLVYFTKGSYNPDHFEGHDSSHDDDLILGAVEWLVPGDETDNPPDIFNDEDSPRNLKVTEEEGWHFESAGGFTGLHAWVHRGNPAGVFHPTNPTID